MKMKTKQKSMAAAETLAEMSPPISADGKPSFPDAQDAAAPEEGKPGLPDKPDPITPEDGKPGLPEPEPEPEYLGDTEEDTEEDDEQKGEQEITFTEEDRKDLILLEKKVEGKLLEAARAIRQIRQRQLWRLAEDDQGKPVQYANFEEYCQDHLGHSRQWVTHLTNWLRIMEELEALGFPVPHLTVKAAQGLLIGRLQDAGGLRAVLEEAKEDGVPLDRDHLREIVIRRADFNYWSKDGTEGVNKPAATDYADYKKDLAAVKELADGQTSWDVVKRAKAQDGNLANNLVALCQEERVLPHSDNLLKVLTGEALADVVSRLRGVGKEQAEIEEKKKLLAARKKEVRAMLQEGGLRKLKDEAKALEKELKAKGVLKTKTKPTLPTPQGGSSPPSPDTPQDGEEDQEPDSEVYMGLQTAWETLDEALSGEWPQEDSELNAILLKSQECETKLAEITAKVKELLADAEEPEAVPSGND